MANVPPLINEGFESNSSKYNNNSKYICDELKNIPYINPLWHNFHGTKGFLGFNKKKPKIVTSEIIFS